MGRSRSILGIIPLLIVWSSLTCLVTWEVNASTVEPPSSFSPSLSLSTAMGLVTSSDDQLCHPSCDCLDTYFDCRKRELTEFPEDFPYWVQKLNMSFNEIRSIEGYRLSRLIQLHVLSLDGNNLTDIPTAPDQLKDLNYLSLSRNALSSVDSEQLKSFSSVRELDLSRNRIELLTNSSFPRNSSLHILNLGANQIESLEPGSLDGLIYLQELILTRNRIKSLSKDLFSFTKNLERLDLSRNKLEVMDSLRFQELKKLHLLNLRRNHMANLSDAAFYGLDKLQHLYLDGNLIQVVEKRWLYGLRSLRTLNLSRNEVQRIEDDSWEYMEELQTLDLSYNKVKVLRKGSLKGLARLRHLDISFNSIAALDENTFLPLEKLEFLDLSYNELGWPLEDMIGPFKGLGDCHTLNLASNKFQTLHPGALQGLISLKSLNLSSNPLKWLSPLTFMEFPSLSPLMSGVQSFVCDCESTWLHSRLGTLGSFVPTGGGLGVNGGLKPGRSRHRDRDSSGPSSSFLSSSTFPRNVVQNGGKKIPGKNSPQCAYPPQLKGRGLTELSLQDLTCSENHPSRPAFLVVPKTQTFLMDGNGSLSCNVQSHSNSPISISWIKDHQPLPSHLESGVLNLERIGSNGSVQVNSSLNLVNVSWADAGSYQCVGQNQLGIVYSAKANVTVHMVPSFVKKPSNVTVRMGSNAKLECGAKGFPVPEIAFQKDGGDTFPAALDRRFHVMPNDDSFIIMEVKLVDMGAYCCLARNAAGEVRACASVTVYETPSFSSRMEDERVVEGSNTILECMASGSPKPQISWSKDNVLVFEGKDESSRIRIKEDGSLLIIKDVQVEDGGRYECLLSNAVGTARDFLTLSVIPSSSSLTHWSSPVMIIALVVVAALCVVATIVAWFVVICRDRRKSSSYRGGSCQSDGIGSGGSGTRRHSVLRYDDLEEHIHQTSFHSPPVYQVTAVHLGDSGSQSSSGKDSGTGDDLPPELEPSGIIEPEEEALMRHSWRNKPELETFSTFGGTGRTSSAVAAARLSQARIELKGNSDASCDVISLAHPPGREFLTMPRKVPMPVPPPFVVLPPRMNLLPERDNLEVGCPSSSSSSGYSSLGIRGHSKSGKLSKERTESVNSNSDGTDSLCGTQGLLSSGGECMSSTDGLSNSINMSHNNHNHSHNGGGGGRGADSSFGLSSDSESICTSGFNIGPPIPFVGPPVPGPTQERDSARKLSISANCLVINNNNSANNNCSRDSGEVQEEKEKSPTTTNGTAIMSISTPV